MKRKALCLLIMAIFLIPFLTEARVTEIDINRVDFYATFPEVGDFEKVVGQAYGEVDPNNPLNAIIQDIELAPKNERGMVEYVTDFYIIKPVNMTKGNRTLAYNIVNRGNKGHLNIGVSGGNEPTDPGDGLLEKRGFTQLWSGWQGDILRTNNRLSVDVPVAKNPDESSITGRVRTEYVRTSPATCLPISESTYTSGTHIYEPVSFDNSDAILTKRVREKDPREQISNDQWRFEVIADRTNICLDGGFDTNHIYELIYTAKDPLVLGLGFAATRDLISFLKHEAEDDFGNPNPLSGGIQKAIMWGTSQSGNVLRMFLHLGFNEDEQGRILCEGAHSVVASGMQPINIRFAQPGRAPFEHVDHLFPRYEGPVYWMPIKDPIADRTGWILERCKKSNTCPEIMSTVTSADYWNHRASATTTDALGRHDLPVTGKIRMYLAAGSPHSTGSASWCQYPVNPNNRIYVLRANFISLYQWVVNGIQPPKSQIPTLREKTLVPPEELNWPNVPGVEYTGLINTYPLLFFGPDFRPDDISGIITENPPILVGPEYRLLVPKVDADGNDIAGIRSNMLLAPIGTYTGWNYRAEGFSEGAQCDNRGIYVPFAKTKEEREANGDPRLSLEERYGDYEGYKAVFRAAAEKLVAERYLLAEDAASLIAEAEANNPFE